MDMDERVIPLTNFVWLSLTTYLFAVFLLVLRNKVSHKAIRPFKILILALFGGIVYFWVVEPVAGNDLIGRVIVFVPLVYTVLMIWVNEVNGFLKRVGVGAKKRQKNAKTNNDLAKKLTQAVDFLSNRKIGALITIERDVKLAGYINKAMAVNAPVTSELLASIFIPTTPLHDGAVIIRDDTILCAKAYYPSTERADLPLRFGTRHRAAIGISEQSDALTIVVSEETGKISVTINRQIDYDVSKETLQLYFEKYLKIK
jgi:diadenylate cyclase